MTGATEWHQSHAELVLALYPSATTDAAGTFHLVYLSTNIPGASGAYELRHATPGSDDGIDQDCDGEPG